MQRSDRSVRGFRARWTRVIALGAVAALALGACGGDDDDDDASEPDPEAAAFCDAYVETNNAIAAEEGDPTPVLEAAQAAAPEEISDAVATMIEEGAAAGEGLPSEAFFEANVEVGEWVADNCGFETIEVTATNYAFDGIPDEVGAGTVLVKFVNEGTELHELVLFGIPEDETRSLDELLALPEEEGLAAVTPVNGFAFAAPDGTFYTTYDLAEGHHAAVCFIPVGLTPEALESGEEPEGAPHFMEGMKAEFDVTA